MDDSVSSLVGKARSAQAVFERCDQAAVDETVCALAWVVMEPGRNRALAEQAVADTGLGRAEDKMLKNHRKTLGLLRDLAGKASVGVIAEYPELGITEIARPVGVVAAVTPSTNPVATPTNKVINAVKGRNAVILAPSPKADATCARLVDYFRSALEQTGAPADLVQKLPSPVSREATRDLMAQADLIVATGSQNNIRAAYSSGTPAIGVGQGNVAVIVDETADCEQAAEKVVASKVFDNATSCSSENSVIVLESVLERFTKALKISGALLLNPSEKESLEQTMWSDGELNPAILARSAAEIARVAGIRRADLRCQILVVEESGVGESYPFSGEKLSPVLTLYRVPDFSAACDRVREIYRYQGAGHSIGLHSSHPDRPLQIGLTMPACRVIVNQAHCFATGGSFDNGVPFSLSMGCGSWGGNSVSDNVNYRHYLNIVRVVRPIPLREPSEAALLGHYWEKHGK
ncbi:MAG: aldehyde dehydrogenase family protein [Pseudomonadota bacterium]|nr:aldehyde dehydrogenase family protein [Pseudomonadota bacterium]MEE3289021.1 aldehyde dehydrogenase family protein [Pseudomonadota bacterium]